MSSDVSLQELFSLILPVCTVFWWIRAVHLERRVQELEQERRNEQ